MVDAEKQLPEPLNNPDLSEAENKRLDVLMDTAGHTRGEAWRHAPITSKSPESLEAEVSAEAQRAARSILENDDAASHIKAIRDGLELDISNRQARDAAEEEARREETLGLLKDAPDQTSPSH
jgi:hypothetical protein